MKQINTTLYCLNKDSSVQEWKVFVEGNIITVAYGKLGGKIQEKQTVCQGKNIGRSNETSDTEQAELEAISKWNAQYLKGYRESIKELSVDTNQVMLAQDASKKPHLISYPCTVHPKMDGLRCLVTFDKDGQVVFNSRGNKTFPVPEHLKAQFLQLKEETGINSFDGELIVFGMPLQKINSLVKKPQAESASLQFYIFDIPSDKKWINGYTENADTKTFTDCRYTDLYNNVGYSVRYQNKYPNLIVVPTEFCYTEQQARDSIGIFMEQGYEGTIIRNFEGVYEYGQRSNNLLKWKLFFDTEAFVESCEEDKNNEGVLHCCLQDGTKFKCKMKGSHEERLYASQLTKVGKYITVKYQALTVDGVPQFPVGICERETVNWKPVE